MQVDKTDNTERSTSAHSLHQHLVIDLNYFPFSHPNATHLPKHEFLSPNNQFYQRICHEEYQSVHAYMVWSQKFRLTPALRSVIISVRL